jgi:hypothetical protein
MIKQLLLLSISLTITQVCFSQNIEGRWTGYLIQNPGGLFERYYYEMTITKQEGNKVWGVSEVAVPEQKISARMSFKGVIKNGVLYYQENEILTSAIIPDMNAEWCIKSGTLRIYDSEDKKVMAGMYDGQASFGACIPGTVYLTKKMPKA